MTRRPPAVADRTPARIPLGGRGNADGLVGVSAPVPGRNAVCSVSRHGWKNTASCEVTSVAVTSAPPRGGRGSERRLSRHSHLTGGAQRRVPGCRRRLAGTGNRRREAPPCVRPGAGRVTEDSVCALGVPCPWVLCAARQPACRPGRGEDDRRHRVQGPPAAARARRASAWKRPRLTACPPLPWVRSRGKVMSQRCLLACVSKTIV